MLLHEICDWIVLIAAVIGAIVAICKAIGKPFKFLNKRGKERRNEERLESLDQLMPQYFEPVYTELEEIREMNQAQNETMDLLKRNLQDVLRQNIEQIYDEFESKKQLPQYVRENLDELYADYKAAKGNHHIDKLYNRMHSWPVTEEKSKYDLDD